MSLSLSPTADRAKTDSMYCNPTEDGSSTETSAPSIKSEKSSTSSAALSAKSTSSSTTSVPKSANWKTVTDPLVMSSKAVGTGLMPMFSTHLFNPGSQTPTAAKIAEGPKAHQSNQIKLVEMAGSSTSSPSTESGKSDKSVKSSSPSIKSTSFLSSFTGSFSTRGESGATVDEKAADSEETKSNKNEVSKDSTGAQEVEIYSPTTSELTVVVEDHSSPEARVHSFDRSTLNVEVGTTRRTSMAESIISLWPVSQGLPQTPNELLLKRVISWEYLGQVHRGNMAYYNTNILTEDDLRNFYTPEIVQKRTHQYFLLGTSIANVLEIPHLPDYVKSLSTTLLEYEHFLSGETKSKMGFFRGARKVSEIRSFEETGEYEYFEVRAVPFEMDYMVIFASLCEIIAQAYKKFDSQKANIIVNSEVFHKIDVKLKRLLICTTRELEAITREALREELNSIDPIASLVVDWDQALGHD